MRVPTNGDETLFDVGTDAGPELATCKVCSCRFTPGFGSKTVCSPACRGVIIAAKSQSGGYVPTPAEIRQGCQAFQAGWSDRERLLRRGINPARAYVEVTTARADDLGLDDRPWET